MILTDGGYANVLSGLLSKDDCRKCRLCCSFDKSDIWDVPVFNEHEKDSLLRHKPETEFVKRGDNWRFKIELNGDSLWSCPALSESGCILGSDKPFECSAWPLRVMTVGGEQFICVADYCLPVYNKPLSEIRMVAKNNAVQIFEYAERNPDIIKPFDDSYIALIRKNRL